MSADLVPADAKAALAAGALELQLKAQAYTRELADRVMALSSDAAELDDVPKLVQAGKWMADMSGVVNRAKDDANNGLATIHFVINGGSVSGQVVSVPQAPRDDVVDVQARTVNAPDPAQVENPLPPLHPGDLPSTLDDMMAAIRNATPC